MKKYNIIYFIALIACVLPFNARGQRIVSVDVDTVACLDEAVVVGFGFDSVREVVVANQVRSRSRAERAFLPDGASCGEGGCLYRSAVTFNGFADDAVISSAGDIDFVRINIEHSYLGDLYINVTCPNGQKADILKFSEYSNNSSLLSPCLSEIGAGSRGWASPGTSNNLRAYLGMPNTDDYSSLPCDTGYNRPGTGWNYCWSNNNDFSYASGGGYVYRTANQTAAGGSYRRVDSSNVAAGTNFYHPDQSFASLVGCPLNGEWYVEVIDGVKQDNGYIFDWELVLDEGLVTGGGLVAGYALEGDSVAKVDDSTFIVTAPTGTVGDTAVRLTAHVLDNVGGSIDTTITIHFYAQVVNSHTGFYCEGDTLRVDELTLTETTIRTDTFFWAGHPCPIIRTIDVTFDQGFRANPLISEDDSLWMSDTMLAGCVPYKVGLTDTLAGAETRIRWHTGDSGWYDGRYLSHTYDSLGIFTVTETTESVHGCRDTAVMKRAVWVFETPEAGFGWGPENPVMSHPSVELRAEADGRGPSYMWEIQRTDGGSDTLWGLEAGYTWGNEGENPQGDFDVVLTVTLQHRGPYGELVECPDTAQRTITIVNDWLQFPNLVTPNGDGTNDRWKVVNLLECGQYSMNELWIYNAWGVPVFHAKDIRQEDDFWDPEATGSPDGTYFFRFMGESAFGIVKRTGMIEVVR